MKSNTWILYLALVWIFVACGQKTDEPEVLVEVVEGVRHIMNPETPLKGTVVLELEKKLEINPYEHEEVCLASVGVRCENDLRAVGREPRGTCHRIPGCELMHTGAVRVHDKEV